MYSTEDRFATLFTDFPSLRGLSVTISPLGAPSIFLFTKFYAIIPNYTLLLTMPLCSPSP